jgi:hypothetical protein
MTMIMRLASLVAALLVAVNLGSAAAQTATPDDTARFLAGMRPSDGSPLVTLTRDGAWQQHSARFNSIFDNLDRNQLARIRAWSRAKLTSPSPVLFYTFSGPDFLYANAFFPDATTYVMAGLEPTGPVPDLTKMSRESVHSGLANIRGSLSSIVTYSFFITKEMRRELTQTRVSGTLPILYVFLARAGMKVQEASLIKLDEQGEVRPADDSSVTSAHAARGAKIVFLDKDGRERTLYYFSTNVANDGLPVSGFARFVEKLGPGDAFVKSASYLMHGDHFSKVRNLLLDRSRTVLQDDSGIPVGYFDQRTWKLRPFGHYAGPISIFANKYQSKLATLFHSGRTERIDFGVGYQWRSQSSNLLVAVKSDTAPQPVAAGEPGSIASAASEPAPEPATAPAAEPKRQKQSTKHRSAKRHAYAPPWAPWFAGQRW